VSAADAAPRLDRRLLPTAGVATLIAQALVDLALLPLRSALVVLLARPRRREIAALLAAQGLDASQDPHPPR
jgi:hypothetical protein